VIAALKPYPAYKDSGIEWLGELPEGWEVRRQGSVAELRVSNVDKHVVEGEIPVRLCNYVDVYKNDRIRAGMTFSVGTAQRSEVNRFRLRTGDVLITKDSETWDDIASPALVEDEADDLVCGYHLAILRPRYGLSGAYLFRASQSTEIASQYHVSANGVTRFGLTHGAVKRIAIPLPLLADQAAIARFLDHVDSRIQRLIAAKERLIELLEEEKQAIIHRAVTRGLDPDVPLKPSGVDWLGDVPEHWEVLALGRRLHRIEQGWSPVAAEGDPLLNQWAVLTLSSVRRGRFNADAVKPVPIEASVPQGIEIRDGDLLMTRSNTRERVGDVCVVEKARPRTVIPDLIYRLSVDSSKIDARFLMNQLLSPVGRRQIEQDARGSSGTMPKIAQRHIRSWKVVAPPLSEQRRIVEALDEAMGKATGLADRAQCHITLLREYRTRLISDVVTGKLDVRDAVERLPDEPDADDAALDEQLEEAATA
jgi:type I restriction enzyme S subunit